MELCRRNLFCVCDESIVFSVSVSLNCWFYWHCINFLYSLMIWFEKQSKFGRRNFLWSSALPSHILHSYLNCMVCDLEMLHCALNLELKFCACFIRFLKLIREPIISNYSAFHLCFSWWFAYYLFTSWWTEHRTV